jgi:membrane-bound lytic murein transglycosylase D
MRSPAMNLRLFLGLAASAPLAALARQQVLSLDQLINSGERLLRENVDPELLKSLPALDRDRVTQFLTQFQRDLQGNYIVDLAALKPAAISALPLLRANPATLPYAGWLESRLDYLDVAEQFRVSIPAPSTPPGEPKKPAPNPSPAQQRQVWEKQVAKEPEPKSASALVPRLKKLFAAQGVPTQLVWVAEVESSFNVTARSPAGAVGLYQLMPQTAQGLGLKLSPRDERLDPDKNGNAAARYLRSLYPRFKDWRLTLAAYNWGQGNVRRLLEKRRATTFDAIAVHLPAETQMYVPKIDAVLKRRERVALPQLPTPTR